MCTPKNLFIGSFNSEKIWRDSESAQLPSFVDDQIKNIIASMDEMQFVFCDHQDDLLVTKYPLDVAFKNYLNYLGFNFINNKYSPENNSNNSDIIDIQDDILYSRNVKYFNKLISSDYNYCAYSILPSSNKFCTEFRLNTSLPDIHDVIKVNSKSYSSNLAKILFKNKSDYIINNTKMLEEAGNKLLRKSPFLIKDDYGVSGDSNILIKSEIVLQSIIRLFRKEEIKRKKINLILQPLLDKMIDFSSHLKITSDGDCILLSIQKMNNINFSFYSIQEADNEFIELLEKLDYFYAIESICKKLYKDGYFGYVCIDSMILKNGELVPLVEINARKSMGLINHFIDKFFQQFNKNGRLMFFSCGLNQNIEFKDILDSMEKEGILFNKQSLKGIFPLTSNTLLINLKLYKKNCDIKNVKGRFYVSIVANNQCEYYQLINTMNNIFTKFSIKVYNN